MNRVSIAVMALVGALLVGACSSGGGKSASPVQSSASSDAASSTDQAGDGDSSAASGPSCPLTADGVASVLGAKMKQEPDLICSFVPADSGEDLPTASFLRGSSADDDAQVRKAAGFVNAVAGIGDEAYATRPLSAGLELLVRSKRGWFQITVNTVDISPSKPDSGADVAKALADLVIQQGG